MTASPNPQAITFPDIDFLANTAASISVPAFTDTVDSTGTNPKGLCGDKEMFISSRPAWLHVTIGADSINDPLTISYDPSFATAADAITHTIAYTIYILDYGGYTTPLTGSFTLTITSACKAETITPQIITFPDIDWHLDSTKSQAYSPFADSLDP